MPDGCDAVISTPNHNACTFPRFRSMSFLNGSPYGVIPSKLKQVMEEAGMTEFPDLRSEAW